MRILSVQHASPIILGRAVGLFPSKFFPHGIQEQAKFRAQSWSLHIISLLGHSFSPLPINPGAIALQIGRGNIVHYYQNITHTVM